MPGDDFSDYPEESDDEDVSEEKMVLDEESEEDASANKSGATVCCVLADKFDCYLVIIFFISDSKLSR